jgi:hypothetical protein
MSLSEKYFCGFLVGSLADVLEVGVFEEGGVFEAVAEETVGGYVGSPDETDFEGQGMMGRVAHEQECQGEGQGVGEVVEGCACAWVEEVAEHKEVWSEEEDGEEEPAEVEVLEGVEGEGEECGLFDADKQGRAGEHEWLYGIVDALVQRMYRINARWIGIAFGEAYRGLCVSRVKRVCIEQEVSRTEERNFESEDFLCTTM